MQGAANKSVEEIRQHIGADSLGYLSLEGLMKAIGEPEERHCNACFTGVYPIDVQMQMNRLEVSRRPVGVADSLNYAGGP